MAGEAREKGRSRIAADKWPLGEYERSYAVWIFIHRGLLPGRYRLVQSSPHRSDPSGESVPAATLSARQAAIPDKIVADMAR